MERLATPQRWLIHADADRADRSIVISRTGTGNQTRAFNPEFTLRPLTVISRVPSLPLILVGVRSILLGSAR